MNRMHEMVIEDEIVMCGAVLLLGFVIGVALRLSTAWKNQRRAV